MNFFVIIMLCFFFHLISPSLSSTCHHFDDVGETQVKKRRKITQDKSIFAALPKTVLRHISLMVDLETMCALRCTDSQLSKIYTWENLRNLYGRVYSDHYDFEYLSPHIRAQTQLNYIRFLAKDLYHSAKEIKDLAALFNNAALHEVRIKAATLIETYESKQWIRTQAATIFTYLFTTPLYENPFTLRGLSYAVFSSDGLSAIHFSITHACSDKNLALIDQIRLGVRLADINQYLAKKMPYRFDHSVTKHILQDFETRDLEPTYLKPMVYIRLWDLYSKGIGVKANLKKAISYLDKLLANDQTCELAQIEVKILMLREHALGRNLLSQHVYNLYYHQIRNSPVATLSHIIQTDRIHHSLEMLRNRMVYRG